MLAVGGAALVLLSVVTFWQWASQPVEQGSGSQQAAPQTGLVAANSRRLARNISEELEAVSPNGRLLVIIPYEERPELTADGVQPWNLAIYDLWIDHYRALTHDAGPGGRGSLVEYSTPVFSPDSEQVAFVRRDWGGDGPLGTLEVRVVGINGLDYQTIYRPDHVDSIALHAWMPDGSNLIVTVSTDDGHVLTLLSLASALPTALPDAGSHLPKNATVSPDGQWVAYDAPSLSDPTHRDVFIVPTAGGEARGLVEGPGSNDFWPLWTPDGGGVLFLSDRLGSMSLWGVAVRDGDPSPEPVQVKPDMVRAIPIGLTDDGTLYYTLKLGGTDIFVANLNAETGQSPVQVSKLNVGNNLQPAWSPDGTRLAYITLPHNDYGLESEEDRLTVLELQSGTATTLSPDVRNMRTPRWAPDGASVLVRGGGGFFQIRLLTGDVNFFRTRPGRIVGWLPDGSGFYHKKEGADNADNIYFRELATGDETLLYRPGDYAPARALLSPDGLEIAFTFFDFEDWQGLGLLPVDGSPPWELRRWGGDARRPFDLIGWSSDGRGLIYQREELSASGEPTLPLRYLSTVGGQSDDLGFDTTGKMNLRLDPTEQRVAYTEAHSVNEIWVMEHFLADLATRW